jgi:RNA polymerase sigma-70 factor (ECF subfamily)
MRPLHCGEWQTVTTKTVDSFTDLELAAQSAAGDVAAFEQLYERHRRRVYSLCLRMVGDVTEAEDITQEVFLQVFRKIGTFRGEAALTTWLHRLAVNHVLMHWRKRGIRSEETTEEGDVGGIARPYPLSILDRIALEQAIQKLPPGYRLVFLLHDVEGYEHEEIAAMLGCSVGTSKSQLHKARLKLRSLLRGEG